MKLPEEDFGTQLQHMIFDLAGTAVADCHRHCLLANHIISDPDLEYPVTSNDGLDLLIQNTINTDKNNIERGDMDEPLTHPIHIAELFTPYGVEPTNITLNYTVAGLSKLLLFNAYARARSNNFTEIVHAEAQKYPYPRKLKVDEIVLQ